MKPLLFQHAEVAGLVSVVTPTKNGRQYLQKALDGVASQTHLDWELIVVEDGSRDGAEHLVERFAAQHPTRRVTYLRNEKSGGTAYTRNVSFLASRGEYIAILDCDDWWLPTHLEACVDALRATGDDFAYSTVSMFAHSDGAVLGDWGPTPPELAEFPQSLFTRSFITPSATVMRRRVLGEVGAWDARHRSCEDIDFFLRAIAAGKRFRHIDGLHCMYRKEHAGAVTQRLAETIEEYAAVASRYVDLPGVDRLKAKAAVATSFELAARLHTTDRLASDPSADPARAALLYLRAWWVDRQRQENLTKAYEHARRYGVKRGLRRYRRPSLPKGGVKSASPARATQLAA